MFTPDSLQPEDGLTEQERELKRRTAAQAAASAPLTEALDRVKRYSDPATNPELDPIVNPKVGKLRGILATIAGGATGMMADSRFGQNALDGAMRVGEAIATPGAQGRRDRYTAKLEGLKTAADIEGRKAQISQQNHQIASADMKNEAEAGEAKSRGRYYESGARLHDAQALAAGEKQRFMRIGKDDVLYDTVDNKVVHSARPDPPKDIDQRVDVNGNLVVTQRQPDGSIRSVPIQGMKFPLPKTPGGETAGVLQFMEDKQYHDALGAALQRNGNDPVAALKDPGFPSKYTSRAMQDFQKDPMFSPSMMADRQKNKPKAEKPSSPGFISRVKEWVGLGGSEKPMPTRPGAAADTVLVTDPSGKVGTIPRSQLELAKQQGFKEKK